MAARDARFVAAVFAWGMAMPSPTAVVPWFSRAMMASRKASLSLRFPTLSCSSTSWAMAPALSAGAPPMAMAPG